MKKFKNFLNQINFKKCLTNRTEIKQLIFKKLFFFPLNPNCPHPNFPSNFFYFLNLFNSNFLYAFKQNIHCHHFFKYACMFHAFEAVGCAGQCVHPNKSYIRCESIPLLEKFFRFVFYHILQ